jgi:hypothetical protein|nr:MAG TPA: hypothetical protein [Bacteriophage sp.]DAZ14473.1 MAG TPA: hypothetical protein [Caudoviricetes sp.]
MYIQHISVSKYQYIAQLFYNLYSYRFYIQASKKHLVVRFWFYTGLQNSLYPYELVRKTQVLKAPKTCFTSIGLKKYK